MKLDFDKIKEITKGAVRVIDCNDHIRFYRFTQEQEDLYKERLIDFYYQSLCTSGIRIVFKTDSKSLFLKVNVPELTLRKYFSFDVLVNDKTIGSISNFNMEDMPSKYIDVDLSIGKFSETFDLGEGEKKVCIYFPWSVVGELEEIALDDGSFCEAIPCEKKILAFGDSITQGYDALKPSQHYVSRLADKLGADVINKAVAGDRFFPELTKTRDFVNPELITCAYGTNDWDNVDEQEFMTTCRGFYENLSNTYSNARIFAISPIWRTDELEDRKCGRFSDIEKRIQDIVSDLKNITFVSGYDFVPHDKTYYADFWVHPNDKGFETYFEKLYNKITK